MSTQQYKMEKVSDFNKKGYEALGAVSAILFSMNNFYMATDNDGDYDHLNLILSCIKDNIVPNTSPIKMKIKEYIGYLQAKRLTNSIRKQVLELRLCTNNNSMEFSIPKYL